MSIFIHLYNAREIIRNWQIEMYASKEKISLKDHLILSFVDCFLFLVYNVIEAWLVITGKWTFWEIWVLMRHTTYTIKISYFCMHIPALFVSHKLHPRAACRCWRLCSLKFYFRPNVIDLKYQILSHKTIPNFDYY